MSEQELFGLMAVAQEQQQVATLALQKLEQQQAKLTETVEQARRTVADLGNAGAASAGLIEQATRSAVEMGVSSAMGRVTDETSAALGKAIIPAVNALKAASANASSAEESLRASVGWISWKWSAICGAACAGLLVAVWSLATILTPTYREIAELRANVATLENAGGKIKISTCGEKKRTCARINVKASGTTYGENGEQWLILDGY